MAGSSSSSSSPRLHVFVIHAPSILGVRKPSVEKMVQDELGKRFTVVCEYVQDHDPGTVTAATLKQFVKLEKAEQLPEFDKHLRSLHVRQVSNALKHYTALTRAASIPGLTHALVLEDDVLYPEGMADRLQQVLAKFDDMPEEGVLFLGHPTSNRNLFKQPDFQDSLQGFDILPSCESYVVKAQALPGLVNQFLPIRFCANVQLTFALKASKTGTVSCSPNLLVDGSKYGVFVSSVEANNRLFMNPFYNELFQKPDPASEPRIDGLFKKLTFEGHPDIKYLRALFEVQRGRHAEARKLMEECYQLYEQNHALLNNESEFMVNYMNLYRHLQGEDLPSSASAAAAAAVVEPGQEVL